MAKKIDYQEQKLRDEAERTLKDSLSYLLKQYKLPSDWQPTKDQRKKLLELIHAHKYYSYLELIHSILKSE